MKSKTDTDRRKHRADATEKYHKSHFTIIIVNFISKSTLLKTIPHFWQRQTFIDTRH